MASRLAEQETQHESSEPCSCDGQWRWRPHSRYEAGNEFQPQSDGSKDMAIAPKRRAGGASHRHDQQGLPNSSRDSGQRRARFHREPGEAKADRLRSAGESRRLVQSACGESMETVMRTLRERQDYFLVIPRKHYREV